MREKYPKLWCSDFEEFPSRRCEDGVLTVTLRSWDEFHTVVRRFESKPVYLWRGQRCPWPLKSKIDRSACPGIARESVLLNTLTTFRRRLKEAGTDIRRMRDKDIWAIGQHHGLPTPLLDWTESAYVAAYFAFYESRKAGDVGGRVVYALNPVLTRRISKPSGNRFVEFLAKDHPSWVQNKRMERQQGRFTGALKGTDIRDNITGLVSHNPEYRAAVILAAISLPDAERDVCLTSLESEMGITDGYLFADYAGAVEATKRDLGL